MQRETLVNLLSSVAGVKRDGDRFRSDDEHELTVYLGEPGRAMVVSHVQSIALQPSHAEVEARDRGVLYVPVDSICALQSVAAPNKAGKRGGVGFSG